MKIKKRGNQYRAEAWIDNCRVARYGNTIGEAIQALIKAAGGNV